MSKTKPIEDWNKADWENGATIERLVIQTQANPPQKPYPKATPCLWQSKEEGQIQVLTELKEVLENYLKN